MAMVCFALNFGKAKLILHMFLLFKCQEIQQTYDCHFQHSHPTQKPIMLMEVRLDKKNHY